MSLEDGPVEKHVWKEQLTAHAVEAGAEPRLFGYAITNDLARHYSFAHYMLLSLTGELPDDATAKTFETALFFAAQLSVADGPIHATVVARLCGSRTGGVLAVGAMALAEHADPVVDAALASIEGGASSSSTDERVSKLRDALAIDVAWPDGASLDEAVVATLRACGLASANAITMALVMARLPLACAEALAVKPADFRSYPIDTPHFEYTP